MMLRDMNITHLCSAALLGLASLSLPTFAAPKASPAAPSAKAAALDGILFPNYPYTILTVKASSSRDSVDGAYDHTIVLRFHRDRSRRVDIKVLSPGEKRDSWGPMDEWGTYDTPATAEGYEEARLHYVLADPGANDLQLHVRQVSPASRQKDTRRVQLISSSYTYALGGGRRLYIYDLAPEATICGSNK